MRSRKYPASRTRTSRSLPHEARLTTTGDVPLAVLRPVLDKRRIRCACLGTALNLPTTTVTLAEDLGMAAMAAAALLLGHGGRIPPYSDEWRAAVAACWFDSGGVQNENAGRQFKPALQAQTDNPRV